MHEFDDLQLQEQKGKGVRNVEANCFKHPGVKCPHCFGNEEDQGSVDFTQWTFLNGPFIVIESIEIYITACFCFIFSL